MPLRRSSTALVTLFASCCAAVVAVTTGCGNSTSDPSSAGGSGGTGGSSAGNSAGGNGGASGGTGGTTNHAGTGGSSSGTGGTSAGGAGGTSSSGDGAAGASGTGGTSSGTGGSGGGTTACTPTSGTPAACTSPQVKITEVDLGGTVVVNEDDAALKLLSISPIPSGGSRVAWMSNDSKVHITTLDCADNVVSTFALPAMDYGDIYADDAGGVLLVTRDAQGGGTLNCGAPTNLCGTPPNPAIPCYDMYMVRFDGTTETWATKLTTSSASLPPYSTGPTGPQTYFVWWYAHHGRLAFDGTNWAGYYGTATQRLAGVHERREHGDQHPPGRRDARGGPERRDAHGSQQLHLGLLATAASKRSYGTKRRGGSS